MKKALVFFILFAFIFSSCATAPLVNNNREFHTQLRIYPVFYPHNGYTNTTTLAIRINKPLRILDEKAAELPPAEPKAEAKKSIFSNPATTVLSLGVMAVGGYLLYDYFTNPDSILKK